MGMTKHKIEDLGGFPYVTLDERDTGGTTYGVIIYPAADSFVLSRGVKVLTFSLPAIASNAQRLYEVRTGIFSFNKFSESLRRMCPQDDDISNRVLGSLSPTLIEELATVERHLFESGRVLVSGTEAHRVVNIRPNTVGGYARI